MIPYNEEEIVLYMAHQSTDVFGNRCLELGSYNLSMSSSRLRNKIGNKQPRSKTTGNRKLKIITKITDVVKKPGMIDTRKTWKG